MRKTMLHGRWCVLFTLLLAAGGCSDEPSGPSDSAQVPAPQTGTGGPGNVGDANDPATPPGADTNQTPAATPSDQAMAGNAGDPGSAEPGNAAGADAGTASGTGGTGGMQGSSGGAGAMSEPMPPPQTTLPNGCPSGLLGWATTGAGTTGGGDASPLVTTSYSELESAMDGDDARVVHVSGTIDTGGDELRIESNKTLRGIDASATIVGGISIRGNNVIVQNLTIQGNGEGGSPADTINSNGATNIWLDHLNVFDGGDGLIDLTNGSDLATVSWCKFWYTDPDHGHRLALLFGNSSEKCDIDGGKVNHTIHHNWFSDLVRSRAPRLLFGQGHIFNNFYDSPDNNYCIGAGSWASVLVENNYFKSVDEPHRFQDQHPSYIEARGNEYDNTSGAQDTGYFAGDEGPSNDCESALPDPGPWTPPYGYELDPATDIPELVMRCAGPQ